MPRDNPYIRPPSNPLGQSSQPRRLSGSHPQRPVSTPPLNRDAAARQAAVSRAERGLRDRDSASGRPLGKRPNNRRGQRHGVLGTGRRRALVVGGLVLAGVLAGAELLLRSDRAPSADADDAARAGSSVADQPTPPSLMVILPDTTEADVGPRSGSIATPSGSRSPAVPSGDGAGHQEGADMQPGGTLLDGTPPAQPDSGPAGGSRPDWEMLARSVVRLASPDCEQSGSGTIIGDGLSILTNSHVLHRDGDGRLCETYAGFTQRYDQPPVGWHPVSLAADDPDADLAVVRLAEAADGMHPPLFLGPSTLALGDEITILGYPGFGESQDTLTFTSGRFSGATTGSDGLRLWKTDALLDSGVSGGAVFDGSGQLVGVATGGFEGEGGTLGLIIPAAEILRFVATHGIPTVTVPNKRTVSATDDVGAALPPVTFPDASVRDAEVEAADLERRRSVIGLFEKLRVAAEHRAGYDRDALFDGWLDLGGLSTRERVLRDEQRSDGTWFSAYDASVLADKAELDIDHLVPLAEAWESGGHLWTEATWTRYANDLGDPRSLIAVSASTNRSKSARDPAEWWPSDAGYRCQYAADWIAIKVRWDLTIDTAEQASIDAQLGQCTGADFNFAEPVLASIQGVPSQTK